MPWTGCSPSFGMRPDGDPPGGEWTEFDPVSRGRVQILPAGGDPVRHVGAGTLGRRMAQILEASVFEPLRWSAGKRVVDHMHALRMKPRADSSAGRPHCEENR